jgi:hypothetical protein
MRRLLLAITLLAVCFQTGFAQNAAKATNATRSRRIAVAFFDDGRLRDADGEAQLKNFRYFFTMIQEIAKKDFPDVELKLVGRGELVKLPDHTNLNVETMQPKLGFILAQPGAKRRVLTGVQTDADFACAAAAYFKRNSAACPK